MKIIALNILANLSRIMVKQSVVACEFIIYEEKLPDNAKKLLEKVDE